MTYETINDNQTVPDNGEGTRLNEAESQMDKTINDGRTMRPKDETASRGAFAPGDEIAGRYVVEKILGEGGMGIVYQCLDKVGGVKMAVKSLPPEVSRNKDEMEDIRANYRLVSDLHHENIAGARTLELDESTGDFYLVMDLAGGIGLNKWMKRNPQASTAAKLAILRQVAAALDYAHSRKVIHRDIKPENVMVDDDGVVKVLDFGLAAQIRSSQSRASAAVTSKGGTPGYKSPEQWRGKAQREPADVYSFGVMAYWMFAGKLPFDGNDLITLGQAVLTEPVEPVAGIPDYMNAALAKALAKKPEERCASCGEFVAALEGKNSSRVEHVERVEDKTVSIKQPPVRVPARDVSRGGAKSQRTGGQNSPSKIERVPRKGRGSIFLVIALLVALAGGGAWLYHQHQEQQIAEALQREEEAARKAEAESKAAEKRARQFARKAKEEAERRREDERKAAEERKKEEVERLAKEKAEAERKAVESAHAAATEIRIEARVQRANVERISDTDGFKEKKDALVESFARAEALFDEKTRRWNESAVLFTNYVNECNALIALDGERHTAGVKRNEAMNARQGAQQAQAGQYAAELWVATETLMADANQSFMGMSFSDASIKFEKAASQFAQCEKEASEERKRQADIAAAQLKVEQEARERAVAEDKKRAEEEAAQAKAEPEARERAVAKGRRGKVQLWAGGPYWADRNIGANRPEEYGLYFWWGDTVGYAYVNADWVASNGSLSSFSFYEAKTPTSDKGKSRSTLQSEGWITMDGVLAPEHDAAHVRWGGNWRMPTKRELQDLVDKCDWNWTTMNGVNGYKVRGKGDYAAASIFLPAAGYGYRTSLTDADSSGYYWSSGPSSGNHNAGRLYFYSNSGGIYTNDDYRYYGQSVRPVQGFSKQRTR